MKVVMFVSVLSAAVSLAGCSSGGLGSMDYNPYAASRFYNPYATHNPYNSPSSLALQRDLNRLRNNPVSINGGYVGGSGG